MNDKLILTNDEFLTCSRCGQSLPTTSFYRRYDGYQPYCIECSRQYKSEQRTRRRLKRTMALATPLVDIIDHVASFDKEGLIAVREALEMLCKDINKRIERYGKTH